MVRIECGCGLRRDYSESEIKWDNSGCGYATKYVVCPDCGKVIVIRYEMHDIDVNNDERFYEY